MSKLLDGGYYAIRGFNFQYDHTVQKILDQQNENEIIEIEQVEDISDSNCIIQVKYKEKSNFTNSSVKKPICKLLELFKTDTRQSILYAYFKKQEEGEKQLTLVELNAILGDCKVGNTQYEFNEGLKSRFLTKFKIKFTNRYHKQFEELISKICEEFNCDEDEAQIYYCNIYKYIERKVLDNPPELKQYRTCSKRELKILIEKNNELIFYKQYSNFKGKEKYYRLVKNKYFTGLNTGDFERFFILTFNSYNLMDIKDFIYRVKDKFYKTSIIKHTVRINSPAPYIFLNGITSEDLKLIKMQLQLDDIVFRDGYAFQNSSFYLPNLLERCNNQNHIQLKFINNIDDLPNIISKIATMKKIYQFHIGNRCQFDGLEDIYNIDVESISDINNFIF